MTDPQQSLTPNSPPQKEEKNSFVVGLFSWWILIAVVSRFVDYDRVGQLSDRGCGMTVLALILGVAQAAIGIPLGVSMERSPDQDRKNFGKGIFIGSITGIIGYYLIWFSSSSGAARPQ